ncbi:MAG: response regulator [Acidipila sp.]|nr:response regulator [Acidipila sp.]
MDTIELRPSDGPERRPVVLAVDDDAVSLRIIRNTLEKNGFTVKTANSSEHALELLSHFVPDILLLDVMMPGLSGYELCLITKQDPRLQNVPVIFLTGQDTPTDFSTGQAAGAVFYLTKPIRPDRLLQVVRMLPRSAHVA